MKKLSTVVSGALLGLALSGLSTAALATTPPNKTPVTRAAQHLDARLNHMQKSLGLTDSQRDQMQAIFKAAREERKQLRATTHEKVQKILTSEQRAKIKEKRAQYHAHHKQRMQRHHHKCDSARHASHQHDK